MNWLSEVPVGVFSIALAVLGAIVSIIEYSGWKRWVMAGAFVLLGVMEVLVILKAENAHTLEVKQLKDQLNAIQRNTEKPQPAPVINLPPPLAPKEHTHVSYLSQVEAIPHSKFPDLRSALSPGKPMLIFAFRNVGDFAAQRISDASRVILTSRVREGTVFDDTRRSLKFIGPGSSIPAKTPDVDYHTGEGPTLTESDIGKIRSGELYLCGVGAVRWSDATGRYETRFAQCLESESDHTLNWHSSKDDNAEYKLK